jgi:glycosyltransferase involved in cell wall biosynthesis
VRIAIDASRAARPNPTGTEAYSRNLIRELPAVAAAHRLTLYADRPLPEPPRSRNVDVRVVPMRRLWTHARLSWELLRSRPDALLVPSHVVPLVHPAPTVVTIHDLGYLRYRLAYRPGAWIYLLLSTLWSARVATRVIADSEATRRDLVRHAGIAESRVVVVPLGVEERFRPLPSAEVAAALAQIDLEPGYLLFVGTPQPRKNLPRVLRAYASLGPSAPPLVIAGGSGGRYRGQDMPALIDGLGLCGRVRTTGYVASELLPALYCGARALVFPTLYEGFGLPLLEAMACGTPVIGGANSSMPEIVGDAGLLVDAQDQGAIAESIRRLVADDALCADLRSRGLERARAYTWRRTAEQTVEVVERAVMSSRGGTTRDLGGERRGPASA